MSDENDRPRDAEHDPGEHHPGEHDPGHEAAQDQVRRLLAAAGRTPPQTPADVAARLDRVLADLVAERATAEPDGGGTSTELDRRRDRGRPAGPRRRWANVLVAAAAASVVVAGVGVGVGTVLDTGSGGGDAALSTDDAGGVAQEGLGPTAPVVRTARLHADVQRIAARDVATPADRPGALADACVQPRTGPGDEWVAVRLDGEPAVLVLRAADGGRRTADVFTCDDARTPAVTTTVAAR